MVGGFDHLKAWIGHLDPAMVQVPFPDGFRYADLSFEGFERELAAAGVEPKNVAGVICETYQGAGASFAPPAYFQRMREWCEQWDVILTLDEIQAAFGRCGTMWGFEHYGIVPDLVCLGKGISSSLPVAAVVGQCGPIGFVGLVVPHMVSLVVGSDCRVLLPASALMGGAFLIVCDWASQLVMRGAGWVLERQLGSATLPIGVVTAIVGVPLFLILLRTRRR